MKTNNIHALSLLFMKEKSKKVFTCKCLGNSFTPIVNINKGDVSRYLDRNGKYNPKMSELRKKAIQSSGRLKRFTAGLLDGIFTEVALKKQLSSI